MMHGPLPDQPDRTEAVTGNPLVAALGQALALCNSVTAPIILPPLRAANFDIVAPDIPLSEVIWGTLPFVLLMMLAVLLLLLPGNFNRAAGPRDGAGRGTLARDLVGWAKRSVPTIHHRANCEMVGTLRFAHPTALTSLLAPSRSAPPRRG